MRLWISAASKHKTLLGVTISVTGVVVSDEFEPVYGYKADRSKTSMSEQPIWLSYVNLTFTSGSKVPSPQRSMTIASVRVPVIFWLFVAYSDVSATSTALLTSRWTAIRN
ncbi:hypothetical protein PILCRDRAFT_664211 [Piloderma croceum F 1598]|uniref:Uncharacterized protein n=1 Tax=Piloderma croceum (strain F 1598) TaxID=765440 RepID=A0A0C3BEM6_PILCF|nr:hypothetical protein PILCRDRAFT_664211 [Piloderma croceum F 1598]